MFPSLIFSVISLLCSGVVSITLEPAPDTLKYVFAFYRYGNRTPDTIGINNDPNREKYAEMSDGVLGELTTNGKKQMYEVGKTIKSRYQAFLDADSPFYGYREDKVRVSSTATCKTIKSALLLSAGLFPPKYKILRDLPNWQPIPVWQNTKDMDKAFMLYDKHYPQLAAEVCPQYGVHMLNVASFLKQPDPREDFAAVYKLLQTYTGNPSLNSVVQVLAVWDTLYLAEQNNLPIPDWAKKVHPELGNQPLYPNILVNFYIEHFVATQYTDMNEEVLAYFSGPIFNALNVKLLRKQSKVDSQEKMWLHVTHDTTLFTLLRTLKIDSQVTAEPGDGLIFELHVENDKKIVKIFLFDSKTLQLIETETPNCPNPCSLAMFTSKFQALTPQQWQQKCKP